MKTDIFKFLLLTAVLCLLGKQAALAMPTRKPLEQKETKSPKETFRNIVRKKLIPKLKPKPKLEERRTDIKVSNTQGPEDRLINQLATGKLYIPTYDPDKKTHTLSSIPVESPIPHGAIRRVQSDKYVNKLQYYSLDKWHNAPPLPTGIKEETFLSWLVEGQKNYPEFNKDPQQFIRKQVPNLEEGKIYVFNPSSLKLEEYDSSKKIHDNLIIYSKKGHELYQKQTAQGDKYDEKAVWSLVKPSQLFSFDPGASRLGSRDSGTLIKELNPSEKSDTSPNNTESITTF